jgi:hypothetical protein
MPAGTAQGLGMHDEYKSVVAFLMECDARGPEPRITKVTIVVDPGRVVNPKGLESQLMAVTMDGIALAFSAGLHIDGGVIRETGLDAYRLGRMYTSPFDIAVHILPPTSDVPGGAGELGLPAACAAAANSWARATGRAPPVAARLGFGVLFVEVVEPADRTEAEQAGAEVLVVASRQEATAALAEAHDPRRVLRGESVAGVDRHEPELVVAEGVERAQRRVVLADVTVAGRHLVAGTAQFVGEE